MVRGLDFTIATAVQHGVLFSILALYLQVLQFKCCKKDYLSYRCYGFLNPIRKIYGNLCKKSHIDHQLPIQNHL